MNQLYGALLISCLVGGAAQAQDMLNHGAVVTVRPGATLYVGKGGLGNQANGTLTNAGTLRVEGNLTNTAATLNTSAGALEVRGNFTNAGILQADNGSITFSGSTDEVFAPSGASFARVVLNKPLIGGGTLRLAGDLTVSSSLSLLGGQVATQAPDGTLYTLRLPEGATLDGEAAGRYVRGAVQITRTVSGSAAVDFGHGAVLDPLGSDLGAVSITRVAGLLIPDVSYGQQFTVGSAPGIDRIWTVVPAHQPVAAVQLKLSWLPDNDNGNSSAGQAQVWQQTATGQPWTAVGAAAAANTRSIIARPVLLNRFTVSALNSTLAAFPATPAASFVVYPSRVAAGQAATYLYTGPVQAATLQVLDAVGRVVRTAAVDGRGLGQLPLAGLAAGTYLLRYTTLAGSFSSRCVVE